MEPRNKPSLDEEAVILFYNTYMTNEDLLQSVVSLCKRRGYIYPGSEIYGGLANTYDFGPLGAELKRNVLADWWKRFVTNRQDIYGLDGGIILNPKIWEASGHVEGFVDPLTECKSCHLRFRADLLGGKNKCPECGGELTKPKMFNAMFKTFIGATEDDSSAVYLRPETAQTIFVNFKNILDSFSPKLPFGIAQIGKAFRNEITAGYFIFRSLEFTQMEIEYFVKEKEWENEFSAWQKEMKDWAVSLGIDPKKLKFREHGSDERSHYSKKTVDLEYSYPAGFKELYGLAYRADYDLKIHAKSSGVDLKYSDPGTNEKFIPHVVEPSFGLERTVLSILLDAYSEDKSPSSRGRLVLKLKPHIAPYKAAVFPLLKNNKVLVDKAKQVFDGLKRTLSVAWDDRGNIGKRYYSQDEIGTPWCVTIDHQTLKDDTVTIRDRDTTKQERVKINEVECYIVQKSN